jgi:uncharacterized protein (UPF0276 family)
LDDVLEHIAQLPGRKLVHSVGTPVGGSVRPESEQLALLRRTIDRLEAPWMSDHLSFNSTPEFRTGFFLPPRQTMSGVATVATSIRDLKAAFPVPVAVETGVNYLRPRTDEMLDGAFVAKVIETADCGLLLDLHNIFANALNGRQSMEEFLAQLPLDCVWEVHVAGGTEMDGFWLDAHSGAIPTALFDIAKQIIPELPNLKAIIFEIFPSFVSVVGSETVLRQIERLHQLWDLREQANNHGRQAGARERREPVATDDRVSPAEWEHALGALAIGRPPTDDVARDLAVDRGVDVIRRLICEFRASMIVNVLRLTARLMMLSLGEDVFRVILYDFWSKVPPQQYASTEAQEFAKYLQLLDLKVPQLSKTLEFECAVLSTMLDETARVVSFDFNPLPLLGALAEGRLPTTSGEPGDFEIEVTPEGVGSATGMDLESVQQVFPYH